jgi:hypothetical protein
MSQTIRTYAIPHPTGGSGAVDTEVVADGSGSVGVSTAGWTAGTYSVTLTRQPSGESESAPSSASSLAVNAVAPPSISVVQARSAYNSGSGLTSIQTTISSTSGRALIAFIREGSNATDTMQVTDSAGNTWTNVGYASLSGTNRSSLWYCPNANAVTSVTCTFNTGGGITRAAMIVYEAAGVTSLDVAAAPKSESGEFGSYTSNTLTTTVADTLLISATDNGYDIATFTPSGTPTLAFASTGSATTTRTAMAAAVVSSIQTGISTGYGVTPVSGTLGGSYSIMFAAFR